MMLNVSCFARIVVVAALSIITGVDSFAFTTFENHVALKSRGETCIYAQGTSNARRKILLNVPLIASGLIACPPNSFAADTDVESFLKSGGVAMPMGVSGQAGKGRPETGIIFRDGSEVARDSRTGDVLTEILVGPSSNPTAVIATFTSPWSLQTGSVFDVECRDGKTGDGAFLSVTKPLSKDFADTPTSFFTDELFKPTGRFSFYGAPTDVKVKKSRVVNGVRYIDLSFSTLSQSTMTEIPRNAIVAATVPSGSDRAVVLVGSASANRWVNKGAGEAVTKTVESFRAVPAPKTSMKVRARVNGSSIAELLD